MLHVLLPVHSYYVHIRMYVQVYVCTMCVLLCKCMSLPCHTVSACVNVCIMHTHLNVCIMHTHLNVCVAILCLYVCMYVCTYACMCVYVV